MDSITQIIARLAAWDRKKALPIADTCAVAPDDAEVAGISAIKIVTEEAVQALAFGPIDGTPQVIARVHPMSRDADDLEPFAAWLVGLVEAAVARGVAPTIWVPHAETIELLAVLGHRYHSNASASETLRRMGTLCLLLAEESSYPGQQVVREAVSLLRAHVTTGQMPCEDAHLGALLAWVTPVPGRDPAEVAAERARLPLSSILANTPDCPEDKIVEAARRLWKRSSPAQSLNVEARIISTLSSAVLREWSALVDARKAFWDLGLPANPEIGILAEESAKRMAHGATNGFYLLTSPHSLSAQLGVMEEAQSRYDGVLLAGDSAVRRIEKERGRVLDGTIVRIDQPRPNFSPCHVEIETSQRDIRFRVDKHVSIVGSKIEGVVRGLRSAGSGRIGTIVTLEISKGFRSAQTLAGVRVECVESSSFSGFRKRKFLLQARARNSWMLFGNRPAASPRRLPPGDLLDLVAAVRRQS